MNRTEFLQDSAVEQFTTWLAATCDTLIIDLDIKSSRFVPAGTRQALTGMNAVLQHYVWRTGGTVSGNWPETKTHLGELAVALKLALAAADDDAVMNVCRQILVWGGDRNSKVGASPFLQKLHAEKTLAAYLGAAKRAFALDGAKTDAASVPATRMNSMLTKVHALASDDGLPIYDSRVAAAIAALVELWRRDCGLQDCPLPDSMVFPATLARRSVHHLFSNAARPGVMSYAEDQAGETARRWSGAKIRLAWVMAEVLKKSPALFAAETSAKAADRMHALEATLFIIGYDVACLARNSSAAGVAVKEQRQLMAAARTALEEEQRPLARKLISTLGRTVKKLDYAGNVETGISGTWGRTRFAFERDFLPELLGNFQSMDKVELGAAIEGEVHERTLGRWIDDHHPGMPRKYASAIAAILVSEGLASQTPGAWPIELNFP